jgi:hypothetical protein
MRRKLSENSSCLLRNSLTLETPGFAGKCEQRGLAFRAGAPRFNPMFTMMACAPVQYPFWGCQP